MSSLSLMEWNAKPPLQWDWENLMMVNVTTENPKNLRATDWDMDGERGIDSGSFNSSGGGSGSGSGGSASDLGLTSLSRSSKSASINSSSVGEVKTSKFSLRPSEAATEDFSNKSELVKTKLTDTSPALEASVGSGEPLLGLKLGKRTYFEDVCAGSTIKTSSFSVIPASSTTPAKRSKSSSHATNVPHCQVEGCNLDLSLAKDYHRKHRVCESHSKCPKVIVAGLERRFCQQCSRFHGLSEFDEKKRSCRRRLSDHNARRRKPHQDSVRLNPAMLASSLYDERHQMGVVWNRTPVIHAGPNPNLSWEGTSSSKFTLTKEYVLKPTKVGVLDAQLHMANNELTNTIPTHHCNTNGLLPPKGKVTAVEVLNQGFEENMSSSTADATQDLHRALSLLSTNSWGSCKPKNDALEQPIQKGHAGTGGMPQSAPQVIPQGWPLSSSEYWRTENPSADSRVHTLSSHNDGNSYFQEFQRLRVPYENDFYSGQLN